MASYSGVRLVSGDEVSRITHPANRPNVRYRYEGWNIKFDWLFANQPTKIQVNVNNKWRDASFMAKQGADILVSYDGDHGATCYQEWTATPDGGFRLVRSFGRRFPRRRWWMVDPE